MLLDFRRPAAPLATRGGLGDSPVEFKSLAGTGDTARAETRRGEGDVEKISSSGSVEVFVSLEGYSDRAAVRIAWPLVRSSNPSIPATEKLLN